MIGHTLRACVQVQMKRKRIHITINIVGCRKVHLLRKFLHARERISICILHAQCTISLLSCSHPRTCSYFPFHCKYQFTFHDSIALLCCKLNLAFELHIFCLKARNPMVSFSIYSVVVPVLSYHTDINTFDMDTNITHKDWGNRLADPHRPNNIANQENFNFSAKLSHTHQRTKE